MSAAVPEALAGATEQQPRARLALTAALGAPAHAYLLRGPRGSGKRGAARAFAAELIAAAAPDPEDARRRALIDPSPHPDLVWLAPVGAQHLVDEVRERVIKAAAYRPFEGGRRVFVIEAAEALADEAQNALLRTLEEPASFAHLVLVSSEPELLLDTITSRCQDVPFRALPAEAIESLLAARAPDADPKARAAAARLAGGDAGRALFLVSGPGLEIRARAEACARAAHAGELGDAPWLALLEGAERAGREAAERGAARLEERLERVPEGRERSRARREGEQDLRRLERRRRTEALEVGLAVCAAWFRDLAARAEGAPELAFNTDRGRELAAADGVAPGAARRAVELVLDASRRLDRNVSEELCLEALHYRLESALA
jgi:DNA polymerase-3 subunit delta'